MSTQVKRFCFTLCNYTSQDISNAKALECKFIIFGEEICPTTGTPHLQGYVEWLEKTTIKGSTKRLPHASFRVSKGTESHNQVYCSKDAKNVFSKGEPYEQGKRNDLTEITNEILTGAITIDRIIVERPMVFHQYGRTLSRIEDIRMRKLFRTEMTTCTWYYGETGVGKSHTAYENYNPETHYNWKDDNGWNDGYAQQPTVIINEFRGHIKYHELLQMVDKWPYDVKRRSREPMPFTSKHIIITSSLPPRGVYSDINENEFNRRIKVVRLESRNNNIGESYGRSKESLQESEESSEEALWI